jgi:iron complex outermembrane receptor protein
MPGPANLTIQGDVYTGDINQRAVNTPSLVSPYTQDIDDDVSVSGGNLLARWQKILSSSSDFTVQAYYDRTAREDVYSYEKRDTFDLDFQHRFAPADAHDILWGGRYSCAIDDIASRYILEFDPEKSKDHLLSAFIQDEISIVEKTFWLILGSKFEHNDFSGYEIQPSGRLLWIPHSEHRFWAAASRAVRSPSRVEHDGHLTVMMLPSPSPFVPYPIKVTIDGDTSFDSEILMAYEAGYRFIPASNFSLDLTFFLNDYDKLQAYVITEPVLNNGFLERSILSVNEGNGNVYGLEASAEWQPAKCLETSLTYSFLNSDATERGVPKHQVSLRTSLTPFDDINMDAWLRYVDDVKASYNTTKGLGMYEINEYVTLDLRIGWHLTKNLELIAVGQNLLDKGHMEFVQEILITPTEIPRSFYGQVKYSF